MIITGIHRYSQVKPHSVAVTRLSHPAFAGSSRLEAYLNPNPSRPEVTPAMETWIKQFIANPSDELAALRQSLNKPELPKRMLGSEADLILNRLPHGFINHLNTQGLEPALKLADQNHWKQRLGRLMVYSVAATEPNRSALAKQWFHYGVSLEGPVSLDAVEYLLPKIDVASQVQFIQSNREYTGTTLFDCLGEGLSLDPISTISIVEEAALKPTNSAKTMFRTMRVTWQALERLPISAESRKAVFQQCADTLLTAEITDFIQHHKGPTAVEALNTFYEWPRGPKIGLPSELDYLNHLLHPEQQSIDSFTALANNIRSISDADSRRRVIDRVIRWEIPDGIKQPLLAEIEQVRVPQQLYSRAQINHLKQQLTHQN